MNNYLMPLISLILDFLSVVFCVKFIFSKRGLMWIPALFLSLLLSTFSLVSLLQAVSGLELTSINTHYNISVSIIWLITIAVFRGVSNQKDQKKVKAQENRSEDAYIRNKTGMKPFTFQPSQSAQTTKEVKTKLIKNTPSSKDVEFD